MQPTTDIEVIHSGKQAAFQPPYLYKYKQNWQHSQTLQNEKNNQRGLITGVDPEC